MQFYYTRLASSDNVYAIYSSNHVACIASVARIYLCEEDMDNLIVVDFITKVLRAKIVQ